MAIDTRQKRRSIIMIGMPWRQTSIPIPGTTNNSATRAQRCYRYAKSLTGAVISAGLVIRSSTKNIIQRFTGIVDGIRSTFEVR